MLELEYHSLTGQSAYFDLLRLLRDQAVPDLRGEPQVKERGGKRYWYDQYRLGSRVRQRYLGEDTKELRDRIARHAEIRDSAEASRNERRRLVRLLKAEGYLPVDLMSGQFLTALSRAGVFRLGGMLVGRQAFRMYEGLLGVRIGSARMASTLDMDIASFERLALAIDDAVDPGLDDVFAEFEFQPVPGLDPAKVWRWQQSRQNTLVEFLTPSFDDDERIRPLPTLGVQAQALHHLDYLIARPVPAAVLYRDGALVQVPRPERYAIHKLIVADRRRDGEYALKARKDREQAAFLIQLLAQEDPDLLSAALADARDRGQRWRDRIDATLKRMPETAALLATLE